MTRPTSKPPGDARDSGQQTSSRRPRRGRLRRSDDDRIVAGVAGGLAEYFDVDPLIVRIAFVVLTLAGGAGVVAYLGAWLLVPPGDGADPLIDLRGSRRAEGKRGNARHLAAISLIGLGVVILLDRIGIGVDGGIAWPIALIGGGAAVLWSQRDGESEREDRPTPESDDASRDSGRQPDVPEEDRDGPAVVSPALAWEGVDETSASSTALAVRPAGDAVRPTPGDRVAGDASGASADALASRASRRGRRRAGRTPFARAALGLMLATIGAAVLAARVGAFDDRIDRTLAWMLLLVGGVLLVGGWLGRPPGFLFVGAVLVGALTVTSGLDVSWRGGFGDRLITPKLTDLKRTYRLTGGKLHLDLTQLDLRGRRVHVDAETSMGQLVIDVPDHVTVRSTANVGAGELVLFGDVQSGTTQKATRSTRGASPADGTLYLNARVGLGQLQIERRGALVESRNVRAKGTTRIVTTPDTNGAGGRA